MERASEKPQLTLVQTTDSCSLCQENKNQFIDFCSQASQTKEVIDKTLSEEQLKKDPDYKDVQPCKHC
ncbi:hypothetical protein ILYODFUR_022761, partial [Ilyodon furcidens]